MAQQKRHSGFSFVEVMISMVILALVTLVIGVVLTTSTKIHKASFSSDEAYAIAREKLAEFQEPDTEVPKDGSEPVLRASVQYMVNWDIKEETGKPNKAKIWVTWDNGNRQIEIFGFIEAPIESCPVINPNNPFNTIALSHNQVQINSSAYTLVGEFSVTDDPDNGDLHDFEIYPATGFGHNHEFYISGDNLYTKVDITTTDSRSIQVKATDCGNNTNTAVFNITITTGAPNQAPTGITLSPDKITEKKPADTEVGTFTTQDINAGDTHDYTLVAGTGDTDNGDFQITGDKLEAKATFNYEAPKHSCSIRVKTTENYTADQFTKEVAITIDVVDTNDAPAIPTDPTIAFTPITTDQTNNSGDLVTKLVGTAITDEDADAIEGIAIREKLSSTGTWQFLINGGSSWSDIGTVALKSALVLRPEDMVRFIPNGVPGSTPYICYYAWDQQDGASQGTKVDVSTQGGSTAYSTNDDYCYITVTQANRAPVLSPFGPNLTSIMVNQTNTIGDLVSSIVGASITDADGDPEGIAIYYQNDQNGTWQYYIGSGWNAFSTVATTSALLLRSSDKVRFVPNGSTVPSSDPIFRYYAWDRSSDNVGDRVDVTTRDGGTAFSTDNDEASITVTADPCFGVATWDAGTVDPSNGDRFVHAGYLWEAKNNPGVWETPPTTPASNWFWIYVDSCN